MVKAIFLCMRKRGMRKCWQSTLWAFRAEAGRRLDKTWKETAKKMFVSSVV